MEWRFQRNAGIWPSTPCATVRSGPSFLQTPHIQDLTADLENLKHYQSNTDALGRHTYYRQLSDRNFKHSLSILNPSILSFRSNVAPFIYMLEKNFFVSCKQLIPIFKNTTALLRRYTSGFQPFLSLRHTNFEKKLVVHHCVKMTKIECVCFFALFLLYFKIWGYT